ncbi:hypothetical protein DNHGIG_29490 [Collibacillus ludicampi]|uniref:Chorismate mutase domain-containing protein n=1 Tax=Collibacillus ludicampi TaxID=2771369 RepID=A0AAV4LHY0_9BACL|nr:hypothetical protein DNHGIG_29490 [Collibacillus ludicampi]
MSADKMQELRNQLDEINLEILELLNKRADLVQQIGELKNQRD